MLTKNIRIEFINAMKEKPFYKIMLNWLMDKPVDDINLAVAISSMLTHSLIAMRESVDNYTALDIRQQSIVLQLWLNGEYNREEIKEYYKQEWKFYFLNANK